MGSTGSGRFDNYQIESGPTGGLESGVNKRDVVCPDLIENIKLEDVGTSEFYSIKTSVPPKSSGVFLRPKVVQGRLVVETVNDHVVIGNLPTQYNYLLHCIKTRQYSGEVISSGLSPIPFVVVTLHG